MAEGVAPERVVPAQAADDDRVPAGSSVGRRHDLVGPSPLAEDALDILSTLDTPAWYGLVGLLSECPVVPAIVTAIVERRTGRVDPKAFTFISTQAQLNTIREFMTRVPHLLRG